MHFVRVTQLTFVRKFAATATHIIDDLRLPDNNNNNILRTSTKLHVNMYTIVVQRLILPVTNFILITR